MNQNCWWWGAEGAVKYVFCTSISEDSYDPMRVGYTDTDDCAQSQRSLPTFSVSVPRTPFLPGTQVSTRRGLDLLNFKVPDNFILPEVHISPGVFHASQWCPDPKVLNDLTL